MRQRERRISGISDETKVNFSESLRSSPEGKKVALTRGRGREGKSVSEGEEKQEQENTAQKICHFGTATETVLHCRSAEGRRC